MVIPERCSGCRLCEAACSVEHFNVNNPRKARVRVIALYPHPVIRLPIFCRQCGEPKCMESCPTDAIVDDEGIVRIKGEECVRCQACVAACPFGAVYLHPDQSTPFKCDLCDGEPRCVEVCPTNAIQYVPEYALGQAQRKTSALKYTHMREVEYEEAGEKKRLRYADMEAHHDDQ